MQTTDVHGKKFLLIGGLGHTDLSGKVPRPGLLVLRSALRAAGHDAEVVNYSTSHMDQMFPQSHVHRLSDIFKRTVKPLVIEGKSPILRPWTIPRLIRDMRQLKIIAKDLAEIEKRIFEEIAHEIVRKVREEKFDAVGFSLFLGSSTTGSIAIADILREALPNLPIIFGGPQTTHFANTIYEETQAPTALVLGEGETAIVEITNIIDSLKAGNLDDLSKIPNIVFRGRDGKIIAQTRKRLSLEDWVRLSAVPYEENDFNDLLRYAFIETSRGCAFECRFCPQPMLSGRHRYLKPAKNIVDEMVELYTRLGITHFEFVGSSTPPSQAEQVALELIGRGLQDKFEWVLFMRGKDEGTNPDNIFEKMKTLKKAGCSCIFFGVEAADNETLKKMGKKEKIEDIETTMLAAKKAGIVTIGSFIYPYPGMPKNEANLVIQFLKRVMPMSAPVQALGILPGTYCSNNAEEIGIEIVYPDAEDQKLYLAGKKPKPTMQTPEVLRYILKYPLILSLPMRFWEPFPYKIDGRPYDKYIRAVNSLQKRIGSLGILTGLSHSHYLIAQILGVTPELFLESMFYCSLTGDPKETKKLINGFNSNITK